MRSSTATKTCLAVTIGLLLSTLPPTGSYAFPICGNDVCEEDGFPSEEEYCPEDCDPQPAPPPPPRLPSTLRGDTSCGWGSDDCNPPLTGFSAIHQVNNLYDGRSSRREHKLKKSSYSQNNMNVWWHWQSINRLMNWSDGRYFAMTRSTKNGTGRFHVYKLGEEFNTHGLFFSGNGQYDDNTEITWRTGDLIGRRNHAGGSQLLGNILGIGMECHNNQSICAGEGAAVAFFDLSVPSQPLNEGVVPFPYSNAGTVSLAKLSTGEYLMIVGEGDAARLNFYTSSNPYSGWTFRESWHKSYDTVFTTIGDDDYGKYQTLHLVTDATDGGKLYIIAMHNNGRGGIGADWVDLYRLESFGGRAKLTKVAKRHIYCHGSCNFDAGSGTYITLSGRLVVYGVEYSPSDCGGNCTHIAEYPF